MEKDDVTEWLMEVASNPIKRNLGAKDINIDMLISNEEVQTWVSRLEERAKENNIGDVHGSHDYRMENILGKCFILGLTKEDAVFNEYISFIINFLDKQIKITPCEELNYWKLYHYRDYQKVLCCYLPFMGYFSEPTVLHIAKQRIEILYNFTKENNYDIYDRESHFSGVKKEWKPYIIKQSLYADGHIALPDIHDLILFAGMYQYISKEEKEKVENIVGWFFGEGYDDIIRRYGYFYVPNDRYNAKAIIFKPDLINFKFANANEINKGDLNSLIFQIFIFSHFKVARESLWYQLVMDYLESFRCDNGHYIFPTFLIKEKKDCYVIKGGHMNVGENRKKKEYKEIISTYWMKKIEIVQNLC